MRHPLVRKRDGTIIESPLAHAEVILGQQQDPETMMANLTMIVGETAIAMQHAQRSSNWVPDKEWTRMQKDMVETIKAVRIFQQETAQADAWAQLTDEEKREKYLAIGKQMGLLK